MSRMSISRVTTILAAMSLPIFALPTASLAQSSPSVATSTVSAPLQAAPPALPRHMSEKVEQHIKLLHDQLRITPSEQPQWTQFAQVMRDNAALMERTMTVRGEGLPTMNAVTDLQSYAQLAQVHATNMDKLASAFQLLYNSFPEQQQKLADTVFRNSGGNPTQAKH